MRAVIRSKEDGAPITPKDVWKPKGLVLRRTDSGP
jgi:hypothetical protein